MQFFRKAIAILCLLAACQFAALSWASRSAPEVDAVISEANHILSGLNYAEYEEATRRLLLLEQSAQSDAAFLACVSRSYAQRRMFDLAEDYLKRAGEVAGENDPEVIEGAMVLAFEQGDREKTEELALKIADHTQKRENAAFYHARAILYANPARAQDYLNIIMDRTSDSVRTLFYIYRTLVLLKQDEQAYLFFYRILSSSGGNPGIFRTAIGREMNDGGYGERLQRIEGQLAAASPKAGLWQQKAEALEEQGEEINLIIDTYWQAYRAADRENDYLKRRDVAYHLAGIYEGQHLSYQSIGCLKLSLEADGFFIPAKTKLEKILTEVKNREEERRSLLIDSAEKLLIGRKRLAKTYHKIPPPFRQGVVFLAEGSNAQAVNHFEKSIKESPEFVPAYRYLIFSYLNRRLDKDIKSKIERDVLNNKAKKACDDLENLEPANIYVQYFRATIANDEGELAEAMLLLKKSAERCDTLAEAYCEMVYTYRKLGLYQEADVVRSGLLAANSQNEQVLNRVLFSR